MNAPKLEHKENKLLMQAKGYLHGSVALSTEHKGAPRKTPVWILRYRVPSGKDSRKVIGKAWTKQSRPARGFLTRAQAEAEAERFLGQHAGDTPAVRRTLRVALDAFITDCERERGLRKSTTHEYRRLADVICARSWRSRGTWGEQPCDTFSESDLLALRAELEESGRTADTLNHYRRVLRGAFGVDGASPALAWRQKSQRVESEGKLRFYTPDQVRRLIAAARDDMDAAIFTLATQAGPRQSEILALKVGHVDFGACRVRFEDGYTTRGGHAGTKGRRVRSVPMSADIARALKPFCSGRPDDALVFEDPHHGGPLVANSLYRRFLNAAKRASLPVLRFHDLRHSFGTQAIRVFNIYEVQRMMGHAHITTTERYLHYAPDPDAAAKLTGLWSGPNGANVIPLRGEPLGSLAVSNA